MSNELTRQLIGGKRSTPSAPSEKYASATGEAALTRLRELVPEMPREAAAPVNVNQLLREVLEWAETRPVSDLPPPPNTGNRRKRDANAVEAAHENAH